MSFPTSPINGQTAVINNVTYRYTATNNSWKRIPTAAVFTSLSLIGNVTTGNSVIAGNVYTDNLKFANGSPFISTTLANTAEITANISGGDGVGLSLVATGVSANTYGSSTAVPVITVDSKGRITNVTTSSISGSLTFTGDVTGTGTTGSSTALTLAASGVTAGNYGSATSIPTIVVDSKGRITGISTNAVSTTITLSGTSGTGSIAGGGTLTFASTNGVTATVSSSTVTVSTPQDLQTTASPTFVGGSYTGNVTISGKLTVANLEARGSVQAVIQDPMTYFQANVLYPWAYDTGLYSDSIGGPANVYAHHGMVRSVDNGFWGFFSNVRTEPDAKITWTDAGLIWDKVKSGELILANSTASSSTTTGALQVAGGAGIQGALYTGSLVTSSATLSGGTITGMTAAFTTEVSTNFSSGNAVISGGSINSTPIGGSSASTGAFTTITATTSISRNSRNVVTNYSGNVAPATPLMGDEWFRGNTGVMYKYLYDNVSNTYNWLNISSALYNANTAAVANTLALRDSGGNLTATNFLGTASSAKYADLAEIYTSDKNYEPGTVVVFGGTAEITVTKKTHDTRVAGVISTNPAYLMNSEAVGLPVAFTGRVPCKVRGPVEKGDVLVTSAYAEYAERMTDTLYRPGCILGKSLGDVAENVFATIEVVVGRF